MDNRDLVPHSEESQGSCSNEKAKLGPDPTQAPSLRGQANEVKSITIKCYKCKEYGHKCSACPNRTIRKQLPTPEPYLPFLPIIRFNCGKVGHKASICPQKKKNKKRYQALGSTSKAMQGSSTAFYNYRTSECPNPSVVEMHLHLYLFVYPSLRMPSIDPNPDSTPSRNDSQKANS